MAVLKIKDQNGNIIPIPSIAGKSAYAYAQDGGFTGTEEEFAALMANSGGGSSSGGGSNVIPDWNQNDSTADDYIKNRPFYSESGYIFDQDVTTLADATIANSCNVSGLIFDEIPADGTVVNVIFDNVTYESTVRMVDLDGSGSLIPLMGNRHIFLEVIANDTGMTIEDLLALVPEYEVFNHDTGEPFLFLFNDTASPQTTNILTKEAGTYNIKIIDIVYHTLDPHFIDPSALLPAVNSENDGQLLTVVDGKWTNSNAPSSLPEITTDDNDKVLMVVDGVWVAASIEDGDEVSY